MSILNKSLLGLALALSIVACVIASRTQSSPVHPFGSVSYASEYHATSTRSFNGTALTNLTVLNSGNSGTFGSVVITGAAAGQINLYDATTSDITKRASTLSSTTQMIATVPLSAVAGTYVFDVAYSYGLLVEIIGTTPTSTITYRQ